MRISCSLASLVLIFAAACGDDSPQTPPTEQLPPAPVDELDAGAQTDAEAQPDARVADDAAVQIDAGETPDAHTPIDGGRSDAAATPDSSMPAQITYRAHIQPLLQSHCLLCHANALTGGGYTMRNYSEASQEASSMLSVTESGMMPPACAAGDEGECLTAQQVGLIRSWIAQGLPEG